MNSANLVKAGYEILYTDLNDPMIVNDIYKRIETAARQCYKSEANSTPENREQIIRRAIRDGHTSVLEHASLSVRFTVDRGISHELVRHRLAAFDQESTRYCNYSHGKFGESVTFVKPAWCLNEKGGKPDWWIPFLEEWLEAIEDANARYLHLMEMGVPPEWARDILPTSLKTELIMTCDIQEWRHVLKLRAAGTTGKPHPQMLEVMVPLLNELRLKLPYLFDDIEPME